MKPKTKKTEAELKEEVKTESPVMEEIKTVVTDGESKTGYVEKRIQVDHSVKNKLGFFRSLFILIERILKLMALFMITISASVLFFAASFYLSSVAFDLKQAPAFQSIRDRIATMYANHLEEELNREAKRYDQHKKHEEQEAVKEKAEEKQEVMEDQTEKNQIIEDEPLKESETNMEQTTNTGA